MPQLKFIKWRSSDFDEKGRNTKPHPTMRGFRLRFPDKSPPLGNPGGPCHVYDRIRKKIQNERTQDALIQNMEQGNYALGAQAELALEGGDLFDKVSPDSIFAWAAVSPHAQYRMDLRGVTLPELRSELEKFARFYQSNEARGTPWFREADDRWAQGNSVKWSSGRDLEIVVKVGGHYDYPGRKGVLVVTVLVPGNNKPRPVPESSCESYEPDTDAAGKEYDWAGRVFPEEVARRYAMKIAPTPGVTTVVRDDSKNNLPTDLDREKQVALPPGSATPGGAGRDIPQFSYNAPDSGSDIKPRTLGIPGEQYGHPSNDTYNTVTRRTMTSAKRVARNYRAKISRRTLLAPRDAELLYQKARSRWSSFGDYDIKRHSEEIVVVMVPVGGESSPMYKLLALVEGPSGLRVVDLYEMVPDRRVADRETRHLSMKDLV